jgi:8-oxo-dGTP diphosphatase
VRRFEQKVLAAIYELAVRLRDMAWRVRRPILVGVRCLVVHDDMVLLVRHRSGRHPWTLPGGGVERYERLAEVARREVSEEAGVPVRVERLLGVYDRFAGRVTNYVAVFVCTPLGVPKPPHSLEIAEARFFPLNAPPQDTERGSLRRIAEYQAGELGVARLW